MQAEGLVAMVGWVEQLVEAAERHISVMQVIFLADVAPLSPLLNRDHRRKFGDAPSMLITSVVLHTNHVEVAEQVLAAVPR